MKHDVQIVMLNLPCTVTVRKLAMSRLQIDSFVLDYQAQWESEYWTPDIRKYEKFDFLVYRIIT